MLISALFWKKIWKNQKPTELFDFSGAFGIGELQHLHSFLVSGVVLLFSFCFVLYGQVCFIGEKSAPSLDVSRVA
jgi:hypothetical protein